jgi:hypothetical protein
LDAETGVLAPWDPNPAGALHNYDSQIYALTVSGNIVYVGGDFRQIGGKDRQCLAAIDATTGAALEWNPTPDNIVWSLATAGDVVYAGGFFNAVANDVAAHIAGIPGVVQTARARSSLLAAPAAQVWSLALAQNAPNPAIQRTSIRFTLPVPSSVTLEVFDVQGRRVAAPLAGEPQTVGVHEVEVQTRGWPSGFYVYRLATGGQSLTRKMLVVN